MKWFQFDIIKDNVAGHGYAMRVIEKFLSYGVTVRIKPVMVAGEMRSLAIDYQCKDEEAGSLRIQVSREVPLTLLMYSILVPRLNGKASSRRNRFVALPLPSAGANGKRAERKVNS